MSVTGNFRGQRTQSSTGGYKTLGSSIASGNNGGAFKRIYINAFYRYNGNSDLALSSTLGIQKGDYAPTNTNNYSFASASGPKLGDYKKKVLIITPQSARTLSEVYTSSVIGNGECKYVCSYSRCGNSFPPCCPQNTTCGNCVNNVQQCIPNSPN